MAKLTVSHETWPLAARFEISRGTKTNSPVVVVRIEDQGCVGWGECVPYPRYGETVQSVCAAIEKVRPDIEGGMDQTELHQLMPRGAARCALDTALWDLRAKLTQIPVWQLADLKPPQPVITAYTLGIDAPETMAANAAANAERPLLKVKLNREHVLERLQAIRDNAPQSTIIVDANEAWTIEELERWFPALAALGISLIEQPLPANADHALARIEHLIPIGADESVHSGEDLQALQARYDVINIKLDKAGGLTEALAMRQAARALGFEIMVGCMVGTSLSMAPAILVAQTAHFVDLDGPLLLEKDREPGLIYHGSRIFPASSLLWG